VSITSDKLFHIAAAPPCARGFARSLREAPLQRFHSIIIGTKPIAVLGSILRKSVLLVATFFATQLTTDLASGPFGGMEVGVGRIALQRLDERIEITRRHVLSV